MIPFRERLAGARQAGGPVILALDIPHGYVSDIPAILEKHAGGICAIKMNMHLLLPLSLDDIREITAAAGGAGLQCIADIKLNDIGSTNAAAADILWKAGFDAVIANPTMGPAALSSLADSAHAAGRGVVSLCHMSSPESIPVYESSLDGRPLYRRFLEWAMEAAADGIIVGATYPGIISECRHAAGKRLDILSPGVGAQGGSGDDALAAGSDYIIMGRSLLYQNGNTAIPRYPRDAAPVL